MWLKAISGAALLIACSACAGPLPERDPSMAWVDVQAQAGHQLSAQRMDGEKVTDARYFHISPGAHQLQVRLTYEHGGRNTGDSQRRCLVDIAYPEFAAGQRYSIRVLAKGWTVRAWLYSSDGERLIESKPVRCGSQYL
ncbi:MAG: hypothetical protein M0Q98_14875 [Pseudomonas sp.]|nr:hypothetical protein [Pseudomonas sp.]MDD2224526.1 hypothetical protein [Pseudomonas sp.]MDY0416016.1 hypothetical protein [Pseudomonas sp.]NLO54864.1 hypothetical protein [Gammaproteobacteria bacterium]